MPNRVRYVNGIIAPVLLSQRAYDNVCKSRFTRRREKVRFLEDVTSCRDIGEAQAVHERMRRGRLRKGPPPRDLLPDEGLGVLASKTDFVRYNASAFGLALDKFKELTDLWISYYNKRRALARPTESEKIASFSFLRAWVPCRADGEVWLFRNPNRAGYAFEGIDLATLPNKLGLPSVPGAKRLTFSFSASRVEKISRPRFYDPKWRDLSGWDWRGKTAPTNGVGTGLEEIVAEPPSLRDLSGEIRVVVE